MRRDVFGQPVWIKRVMLALFGLFSWPRFNLRYTPIIKGAEIFPTLPPENVMIVSNHQTYFADVVFIQHALHAALNGRINNIMYPGFLLNPKTNIYFVAAEETMKSGLLPRIMAAGGAITVKRTWREKGRETQREVDLNDTSKVVTALKTGWVISFPQGTTSPFKPGRKGTAHIIKQTRCLVVPVVIDGFRRAFDKKGLKTKKRGVELRMTIKPPLDINYDDPPELIIDQIMEAIEQKTTEIEEN